MKVEYQYDNDPRYGWASIDLENENEVLIIINTKKGSFGFNFSEETKELKPTCICNAWSQEECCCYNVDWKNDY